MVTDGSPLLVSVGPGDIFDVISIRTRCVSADQPLRYHDFVSPFCELALDAASLAILTRIISRALDLTLTAGDAAIDPECQKSSLQRRYRADNSYAFAVLLVLRGSITTTMKSYA